MTPHHQVLHLPGLRLPLYSMGTGEVVLFLHGFPEMSRYWWPLAQLLPQWHCLMPDLRGCGEAERPADPDAYSTMRLVQDVAEVLDALDLRAVHLVGHDWGGMLAWWFAHYHPERVRSLAVFNAPHPVPFQERLLTDPLQRGASAYFTRLRKRDAGATLLAQGAEALWDRLRGDSGGFDAQDRLAWVRCWSYPQALDGATAWYRESPFQLPEVPDSQAATWQRERDFRIAAPTLIVWGMQDTTYVTSLADESAAFCDHAKILKLNGVRHNPPRNSTAACAQALESFWRQLALGVSTIDD